MPAKKADGKSTGKANGHELLVRNLKSKMENANGADMISLCRKEMEKSLGKTHVLLIIAENGRSAILPYTDFKLFKESTTKYVTHEVNWEEYLRSYMEWIRDGYPLLTTPVYMVSTPYLREI